MSASTVVTRPLREEDIPTCASLHRQAFPGFFLSELGEPFLREFYKGFVADEGALTVVAEHPDLGLAGVVVGSAAPSGFFKRLLIRRWYAFAWASLALVVRRPGVTPRLLRAVFYRGGGQATEGALLSSICVRPDCAGNGIGRLLLSRWVDAASQSGAARAFLETDSLDNERVNQFYRDSGWSLARTYETPQKRGMNIYTAQLRAGETSKDGYSR